MTYEPIDLERLDETAEDLAAWPDTEGEELRRVRTRDERLARTRLYPRARAIDVAPITCPLDEEAPAPRERSGA